MTDEEAVMTARIIQGSESGIVWKKNIFGK